MTKVMINTFKSSGAPGSLESHFGYVCEVGPEGHLFADVPEDMLQNELENGRVSMKSMPQAPIEKPEDAPDPLVGKSKAKLQALLDEAQIPYASNQNKAELVALLTKKEA